MNLLIAGYYGFGNEGDELVLAALLHHLQSRPHAVTVLSRDPQATTARHHLPAINRWSPVKLGAAIRAAEVLILGGGGLIQDLSGPLTPAYYLGLLAWARRHGKKTLLLGQGFGPVTRPFNHSLARRILPTVDFVVARDAASAGLFADLGVSSQRLALGADLAWLLPQPASGAVSAAKPEWGVCLRADWLEGRLPEWLTLLWEFAQANQRRLRFIALGDRGDQTLLEQIILHGNFPDSAYRGVEASCASDRFSALEWLISMRYHGLILGAQAGARVAGWGRDPKLGALIQELGQAMIPEPCGRQTLEKLWQQRGEPHTFSEACARLRGRAASGLEAGFNALGL